MIKTAVVGFGFMGVVHAKNALASENIELCAIIDKRGNIFDSIESTGNAGKLDLPLEKLKTVKVYKSLSECCREINIDAAIICVPLFLHYELTKEALDLGLDVLLEKPFCPDAEQCRKLITLAENKKSILMVAHCIRFAPQWQFLSQCIFDNRYGELKLLSTTRITGEPTWGVWLDEKIKKTCGGALMDLLIHDIDYADSCFGKPQNINVNFQCDDYWEIAMEYPVTNAKVSIKGGFVNRHTPFSSECVAIFQKGSIRFNSSEPETIYISTDSGTDKINTKGDAYFSELEYFTKCILTRNMPEKCPPKTSLQTIEVCQRIKEIGKINNLAQNETVMYIAK